MPNAAAATTTIGPGAISILFTLNAATTLRQTSAIIQNRAGTRRPSKPGSCMSCPYGDR